MTAFYRWATTPPRAYLTYAVLVLLVGTLSFWAGTLKPKHAPSVPSATASQPRT